VARLELGRIGVVVNPGRGDAFLGAVAELEGLGYAAIWVTGGSMAIDLRRFSTSSGIGRSATAAAKRTYVRHRQAPGFLLFPSLLTGNGLEASDRFPSPRGQQLRPLAALGGSERKGGRPGLQGPGFPPFALQPEPEPLAIATI
jgi:hypothetical protein